MVLGIVIKIKFVIRSTLSVLLTYPDQRQTTIKRKQKKIIFATNILQPIDNSG